MRNHIDMKIGSTINKLNRKGFKTKYSCSGHKDYPKLNRGYIAFNKKLARDDIKQAKGILHKSGIKRVSSKTKHMHHGKVTVFNFASRE